MYMGVPIPCSTSKFGKTLTSTSIFQKNSKQKQWSMTWEQCLGIQRFAVRIAQIFNPRGGPGQMLPPLEVLRNPGQDPIFNFGRDEVELNAKSIMILAECKPGVVRWLTIG
jgi:hypothetical protein